MRMTSEHERLVRMIKESITLMCKSSLNYELELNVEGLLGITVDKKDIFLVNINESFQTELAQTQNAEKTSIEHKRSRDDDDVIEVKGEEQPSSAKKKRMRRRSPNSGDFQRTEFGADFELPDFSAEQLSESTPSQLEGDIYPQISAVRGSPFPSPSGKSKTHGRVPPHTETSQDTDSVNTSASGGTAPGGESGHVDLGEIVIKEEFEDGESKDYSDFALDSGGGGSFPGTVPMAGPSGTGGEHMPPGFPDDSQIASQGRTIIERGLDSFPQTPPQTVSRSVPTQETESLESRTCSYCGKVCPNSYCRACHEKDRHNATQFFCGHCGKVYVTISVLKRHQESIHFKMKYPCNTCNKTFTQTSSLYAHQRTTCPGRHLQDMGQGN